MGPELAVWALASLGTTSTRTPEVAISDLWTAESETTLPGEWTTHSLADATGSVLEPPRAQAVVQEAARVVQALVPLLPPVDDAAEARLDALIARQQGDEPRRPIRRRG